MLCVLQGLIDGWRDELYPAVQSFHDEPAFLIERAAAPHFGIKAYGKDGGCWAGLGLGLGLGSR